MVALLVASNVLLILWRVFVTDQRRFARDQGKLSAMQGALILAEQLEDDLREIALRMPHPQRPDDDFSLDRPVRIEAAGKTITFLRFAPVDTAARSGSGRSSRLPVKDVRYAYDAARFRMVRTIGSQVTLLKVPLVESILFELKDVTLSLGGLGLTPPPLLFREDVPLYVVKYQVTASPETPGSKGPADVPVERKFTLVNAVPLRMRAERASHAYWGFGSSEVPGDIE